MTTINLLPWRDEYRQEKTREFFSILFLLVILAGLVSYVVISLVGAEVDYQKSRNVLLEKEIAILDTQVGEIRDLKKQRIDLESKMSVIQGLQNKRSLIVYYFDEMVRAVPDGLYFKSLSSKDSVYSLSGFSESNNRVSALMRNLDQSRFFQSPNLNSVAKNGFDLTVKAIVPPEFNSLEN